VEASLKELITKIEEWDTKVFLSFYKSRFSESTKTVANIYSFFGNFYFWGAIWLIMAVWSFIVRDYDLVILFSGAFNQGFIIYLIIRYKVINRNRPYITLENEGVSKHDDYIVEDKSFPSGHVTFFLYFGFIFAFYYNSAAILIIFLILDILMAFSRLILGVHFPTDVLFGFLFAVLFALLYLGWTWVYWDFFYRWLGEVFWFLSPRVWFGL